MSKSAVQFFYVDGEVGIIDYISRETLPAYVSFSPNRSCSKLFVKALPSMYLTQECI